MDRSDVPRLSVTERLHKIPSSRIPRKRPLIHKLGVCGFRPCKMWVKFRGNIISYFGVALAGRARGSFVPGSRVFQGGSVHMAVNGLSLKARDLLPAGSKQGLREGI